MSHGKLDKSCYFKIDKIFKTGFIYIDIGKQKNAFSFKVMAEVSFWSRSFVCNFRLKTMKIANNDFLILFLY